MDKGYSLIVDDEWFYAGRMEGTGIPYLSRIPREVVLLPTERDARAIVPAVEASQVCFVERSGVELNVTLVDTGTRYSLTGVSLQ